MKLRKHNAARMAAVSSRRLQSDQEHRQHVAYFREFVPFVGWLAGHLGSGRLSQGDPALACQAVGVKSLAMLAVHQRLIPAVHKTLLRKLGEVR